MSKKVDNNSSKNGMSLGELGTIRDILMGPQIAALEERIAMLEDKLKSKISDVDSNHKSRSKEMEKDLMARIGQLEKALNTSTEDINDTLKKQRKEDRQKIGKLLFDLSQHFLD